MGKGVTSGRCQKKPCRGKEKKKVRPSFKNSTGQACRGKKRAGDRREHAFHHCGRKKVTKKGGLRRQNVYEEA